MTGSVKIRASATDKGSQQLMRLKQKHKEDQQLNSTHLGKWKATHLINSATKWCVRCPCMRSAAKVHNWGSVVQCTQWRR